MQDTRPVNLNLLTIRFPLTAVASILHRVAGVMLLVCVPALLWLLHLSLKSAADFYSIQAYFHHPVYKWLIWLFGSAFSYHLLAGVRHLVMDCGVGEGKTMAKLTAAAVIVFAVLLSIMLGKILCCKIY